MVLFDKVCKDLISELGSHMGYISKAPFTLDPQSVVEESTGYKSEMKSLSFTIDIAWLDTLSPTSGYGSWESTLLSDVVVAWEVDSTKSHKDIRSSIDNLATLNPRLGIEYLLIGGNKGAINGFENRYKTALHAARIKPARIIVIHDVIFSQLYYCARALILKLQKSQM